MADAPEMGSPEWWLRRLHKELIERRPALQSATDYYDGAHNLSFQSKRFREAFGGLFDAFADNWCEVVVDASEERLNVEGFRVGDDVAGDTDAWRIWQANDMDGQIQLAHTDELRAAEERTRRARADAENAVWQAWLVENAPDHDNTFERIQALGGYAAAKAAYRAA